MDLSGVIFVVLAIVWAVYLIPKALKQHDEVARTRSVERFSDDSRVVARREPVSRRDARLVVPPAPRVKVEASVADAAAQAASSRRGEGRRTAGKVAARRRRRLLGILLLAVAATTAGAYLGYLPWWSVAVPGGLTLAFLLLCRTQVRRQLSHSRRTRPERTAPASRLDEPAGEPERMDAAVVEAQAPDLVEVPVSRTQPEVPARHEHVEVAPVPSTEPLDSAMVGPDTGALWDPVPVTLPTYVTKPKARRTVRTIDLGEAGTWTSGRTPEDAEIAARATDPAASDGQSLKAGRRAVGT